MNTIYHHVCVCVYIDVYINVYVGVIHMYNTLCIVQ